jgi:hypothetical protein
VLGWPLGPLSAEFPGGDKPAFSVQKGEIPVIPGQHGVQVWDLPGIGRIAILICCGYCTCAASYRDTHPPNRLTT